MADTDFAALWRSLTPAQREAIRAHWAIVQGREVPWCGYVRTLDALVRRGIFAGHGYPRQFTDDGRALARWAAQNGKEDQ